MSGKRTAFRLLLGALVLMAMLHSTAALADFRHGRMGARPRALGSAYVALADDANAVYWNPAGLTASDRLSVQLTRGWLYSVSDLQNDYVCATGEPLGGWHWGASWVRLGVKDIYHEDTINLAVARRLPFIDGLSAGVTGKLFLLGAPGYEQYNDPAYNGGDHDFGVDVGLHYQATGPWTLGAAIYNLTEPELRLLDTTSNPDPVYREWAAGGSYLFRDTLLLTADVRSREGEGLDTVLLGGAEIWFFDALALRAGIDAGLVTMGAGLQDDHWQADFTLHTNQELGNVYMFSFTVRQ